MVRSLCPICDPSFVYYPSIGMSGGILLVWNSRSWQLEDFHVGVYSVLALVRDARANCEWVATSVYGLNQSLYRTDFWAELSYASRKWQRNIICFTSE